MKQKKLPSIIALSMCLEMILAPMPVIAAEQAKIDQALNTTNSVLNMATGIANTVRGNTASGSAGNYAQSDMANFQKMQTPQQDKYFNAANMAKIPGLAAYMALQNSKGNAMSLQSMNCLTLQTTLDEANPEVCRVGITFDTGLDVNSQVAEAHAYYSQYNNVRKLYENYSVDLNGANQPAFGLGCMNNAMDILGGFFKYRVEELNALETKLEAEFANFNLAAKGDLDSIKKSTALLNGENSKFGSLLKTTNPELLDFGSRFKNDACNSIYSGDSINESFKATGLRSLKTDLVTKYTQGAPASAEAYQSKHLSVVEDIKKMADKVSTQMTLNFAQYGSSTEQFGALLDSMGSKVSSTNNLNRNLNASFFSDIQASFTEKSLEYNNQLADIKSQLGPSTSAAAIQSLTSTTAAGDARFQREMATIQNQVKNACLLKQPIKQIYGNIIDVKSTNSKENVQKMKSELESIMSNTETTMQAKLALVDALQKRLGNRMALRMSSSYTAKKIDASGKLVQKVVAASTPSTPLTYITDMVTQCEAQFSADPVNNKGSASNAIEALTKLKPKFKKLADDSAASAKEEILKNMIECKDSTVANATTTASCTPEKFNMGSPGFCANGASSCASNMKLCKDQAQNYVKQVEDERTTRVGSYNAQVEKVKTQLVSLFSTALADVMKQSEAMRGIFNAGFESPTGLKYDLTDDEKNMKDFLGGADSLNVSDPDKYLAMVKVNIAALKTSMEKQQDQILKKANPGEPASGGVLAAHFKNTQKNYQAAASKAKEMAGLCDTVAKTATSQASQQVATQNAEQLKKFTEMGEKRQQFCAQYSIAQANPYGPCESNVSDLVSSAMQAANTPAAQKVISDYSKHCRSMGNHDPNNSTAQAYTSAYVCQAVNGKKHVNDAAALSKIIKSCTNLALENDPRCKKTDVKTGTGESFKQTTETNCKKLEDDIVAAYTLFIEEKTSTGSNGAIASLGDAAAFCSANNNSGPYNTKANILGQQPDSYRYPAARGLGN